MQDYPYFLEDLDTAVMQALEISPEIARCAPGLFMTQNLVIKVPLLFGCRSTVKTIENLTIAAIVACVLCYATYKVELDVKDETTKRRLLDSIIREQTKFDIGGFPVTPLVSSAFVMQMPDKTRRLIETISTGTTLAFVTYARGRGLELRTNSTSPGIHYVEDFFRRILITAGLRVDTAVSLCM